MKLLVQSLTFTALFLLAACDERFSITSSAIENTTTTINDGTTLPVSTYTFNMTSGGDWIENVGGDFDQEQVCQNAFPESGVVFKASNGNFAYCLRNTQDYEALATEINNYCHGLDATFRYLYEGTGPASTLQQGLSVPFSFSANCFGGYYNFYLYYNNSTFDTDFSTLPQ